MQDPSDPRSWLHHWPDIAAGAAGALALVIRTSTRDGPRSWRVVVSDAGATLSLGYVLYRLMLGTGLNADLAFGLAVLGAAMGWEWVRRRFGGWASKRLP
jgi:hypothetical protein